MDAREVLTGRPTHSQPVGLKLTEAAPGLNKVGGDARVSSPVICAAIHGILTGQTRTSWPDEFDAWCVVNAPGLHVIKKEYTAGPFPRINWLKNRKLATGLVEEIELFAPRGPFQFSDGSMPSIWFVAHSNGCVIALMAARMLIERGIKVDGMILTGAACESDVERNGILNWVAAGQLGKAVAMSSADDGVVSLKGIMRWLKWPYGDLGRVGWQLGGERFRTHRIFTLWGPGGHCSYFARDKIEQTFRTFAKLMTYSEFTIGNAEGTERNR